MWLWGLREAGFLVTHIRFVEISEMLFKVSKEFATQECEEYEECGNAVLCVKCFLQSYHFRCRESLQFDMYISQ